MGGPSAWGLGKGLTSPHHEKTASYEMLHRQGLVNMVMNIGFHKRQGLAE